MLKVKGKFLFLTIMSLLVLGACSTVSKEHRGVASEKKDKKSSYKKEASSQDTSWKYYSGQYR